MAAAVLLLLAAPSGTTQDALTPDLALIPDAADPSGRPGEPRLYVGTPNGIRLRLSLRPAKAKGVRVGIGATLWTEALTVEAQPAAGGATSHFTLENGGLQSLRGSTGGDLASLLEPGTSVEHEFILTNAGAFAVAPGAYALRALLALPTEAGLPTVQVASPPLKIQVADTSAQADQAAALQRSFSIALKTRRFDDALALAQQMGALAPSFVLPAASMRFSVFRERRRLQDLQDALALLQGTILPASALRRQQNPEEAQVEDAEDEQTLVEDLQQAIQVAGQEPEAVARRNQHLESAARLMLAGRLSDALVETQAASTLDPKNWMPPYLSGLLQARMKNFGPALDALSKAERFARTDPVLSNLKKPGEAIQALSEQVRQLSRN